MADDRASAKTRFLQALSNESDTIFNGAISTPATAELTAAGVVASLFSPPSVGELFGAKVFCLVEDPVLT